MSFAVNQLIGFGAQRPRVVAQIPQGTGTNIGTMTEAGGLAAAFDGVTSQAQASAAKLSNAAGTVGKDYGGSTYAVTRWKAWGSSDFGFNNQAANGACNVSIEYSDNGSAWTQADIVSVNAVPGTVDRTFASVGSHRYWRVKIDDGGGIDTRCAEVEFYA